MEILPSVEPDEPFAFLSEEHALQTPIQEPDGGGGVARKSTPKKQAAF